MQGGNFKCQLVDCFPDVLFTFSSSYTHIVLRAFPYSYLEIERGLYTGFISPVCIRIGEEAQVLVGSLSSLPLLLRIIEHFDKDTGLKTGCFCRQGNVMESNGMMCC